METDALDYDLPPERIATAPAEPRDAARLMLCDRATGRASHHRVVDLPRLAAERGVPPGPGDLMLVNESRVVPARLLGRRRDTGGKAEGLFLEETQDDVAPAGGATPGAPCWRIMLETRGKPQPGERIDLVKAEGPDAKAEAEVPAASLVLLEAEGRGVWRCRLEPGGFASTWAVLDAVGATPLPPYIRKARRSAQARETDAADPQRYNTVYARRPGSVAAPTAGLHFTPGLLDAFDATGVRRLAVTLHVGAGTFAPVRAARVEDHAMHAERIEVPAKVVRAIAATRAAGRRVLAIGTTTVRAVESLPADAVAQGDGYRGPTSLLITPDAGFVFRHTDALLTNFHLPRSTLLAMVAALPGVGLERLLRWYREAVDAEYRFYSYGDAMLIV